MRKTNHILSIAFTALVLLIASVGVGGPPSAEAETVRATRKVKVMKRPGEQSAVVTRVSDGDTLTVVARQGRWIKVRANGRTGWVTRSSVAATVSARETSRNTRRRPFVDGRSTRRAWTSDAPEDRVGADAVDGEEMSDDDEANEEDEEPRPRRAKASSRRDDEDDEDADDDDDEEDDDGDEEDDEEDEEEIAEQDSDTVTVVADAADMFEKPNKRADSVLTVEQGQQLHVIRTSDSGAWLLVENDDNDAGWVRAKDVSTPGGFQRPEMAKWAGARLGYSAMSSTFASNGTGELAGYGLSSAAAALTVGGQLDYVYSPQYMISADAQYTGTRATPGIRYQNADGDAVDIAFTQHEIDLGVAAGYNFRNKRGVVAYARAGYHYGIFSVAGVEDLTKNLAHLPSEQLKGTTIGGIVDVPRLTDTLALRVDVQALYPFATRVQTVGLEDGATSSVFAAWAVARIAYQWKPSVTLDAGYRYAYAKTDWVGAAPASLRGHDATEAARKDVGHTFSIGLGKTF